MTLDRYTSTRVHLLTNGYRRIACEGGGAPPGERDTSRVDEVTCTDCLRKAFKLYEALVEAIGERLVEFGDEHALVRSRPIVLPR
jgi:hypothetical protein